MRWTLVLVLLLLPACASRPPAPAEFTVAEGGYAAAFDAAKEVLRDFRFELDRVDARAGVITTVPKSSGGLVSPWDREQSGFGQEVEDTLNAQVRRVRVTFEPSDGPPDVEGARPQAAPGPPPEDLRQADRPLVARVQVVIERTQRPLWRVEPSAIFQSSFARDPELAQRVGGRFAVPFAQDPELAGRLAAAIAQKAAEPAADAGSGAGSGSSPAEGVPPGTVSMAAD